MSTRQKAATGQARRPGRPRSEKARKAVLRSTLALLKRVGFHELSMESVAERAGVGKATIYRRWPNKAELVIAAFVMAVEPELRFPAGGPVLKSLHRQMRRWAVIFRSPLGQIVATVIGAGQSDPEILKAFRSHWIEPRRIEARKLLQQAIAKGEIRADLNPDAILDLLYGPLYLRLLLKHAPLNERFADTVFGVVSPTLSGSGRRRTSFQASAPEPEVLQVIGRESKRNRTDRLSSSQIDAVIKAVRRSKRK
jgi:AcrR family transcriptional regulator